MRSRAVGASVSRSLILFDVNQKKITFLGLACLFLLFGCFPKQESDNLSGLKKAPDFQVNVFHPSKQPPVLLSDLYAARPVLLVFWATWCPSCREELPRVNQLAETYSEKLSVLSVNAQESPEEVEKFLTQNHVNFPVLLDQSGQISDLFEVTAIPSILLLAKGGEILYYGFTLPDQEKLEAALPS